MLRKYSWKSKLIPSKLRFFSYAVGSGTVMLTETCEWHRENGNGDTASIHEKNARKYRFYSMRQPTNQPTHTPIQTKVHQWITRSGFQFISFYYRNAFTKYILIFEYILLPYRRYELRGTVLFFFSSSPPFIYSSFSSFVTLASLLCVAVLFSCFVFRSVAIKCATYKVCYTTADVVCMPFYCIRIWWPLLFLFVFSLCDNDYCEHKRAHSLNEFQIPSVVCFLPFHHSH